MNDKGKAQSSSAKTIPETVTATETVEGND